MLHCAKFLKLYKPNKKGLAITVDNLTIILNKNIVVYVPK